MLGPRMIVKIIYKSGAKERLVLKKKLGEFPKLIEEADDCLKTFIKSVNDSSLCGSLKFTWSYQTKHVNVREIASLEIKVVPFWNVWS